LYKTGGESERYSHEQVQTHLKIPQDFLSQITAIGLAESDNGYRNDRTSESSKSGTASHM
jgi:hypothetical protein